MFPSYLNSISLNKTTEKLNKMLSPCTVCPFKCGTNRYKEKNGRCRSGLLPEISSYNIHRGEEPPISGTRGSGTIFLTGCSLRCSFCQNYPISQLRNGNEVSVKELSDCMISLQERGAHNINFVSPTHFVPQLVEALMLAVIKGLKIPIVYNSGGYDNVEVLKCLDGIVDIYLPDMKYSDDARALEYSNAPGYVEINRAAVKEMYRQVGELKTDREGVAVRGLIIRHLVLPGNISNTEKVLESIARISTSIHVSLMSQYFPAHRAVSMNNLKRKLNRDEYLEASNILADLGLVNGWTQPF
ncbi:MAG TPA: radical SAM protein [Spirochaetes bacterium]|nr:radical SAM protein [Spirochaetota bacterium]